MDVDALLAIDSELRNVRRRAEDLRAEQNRVSKAIREAGADHAAREARHRSGDATSPQRSKSSSRASASWRRTCANLWLLVPNIPDASRCPKAQGEDDNVEIKRVGEPRVTSTSSRWITSR